MEGKIMKALGFVLWVLFILMIGLDVMAYTNITPPPETVDGFIKWFFSEAKSMNGAGLTVIIAFSMTVILGLFKFTPLKPVWDKLGNWKFVIPMAAGAIGEVALNWPSPFSWAILATQIVTGATGTGLLAVAFHHVADNFISAWKKK